jgi:hypothetical protein
MTYEEIFKDRVIYITGAGRSGTTIMGKLLGSMRPAHYLFEPFALRAMTYELIQKKRIRRIVFEDLLLPTIQCRSINWNKKDWTYWGNYMTHDDVQWAWQNLPRRDDVIKYIQRVRPYWIIKNPEAQPIMDELREIFPGVQFVHMIRNGLDVVTSAVKQGWYTDEYCEYQGCSFWVDDEAIEHFDDYDQATKAACVWRCLNNTFLSKRSIIHDVNLKYEHLAEAPENIIDQLEKLYGLRSTPITRMHIEDIKNFKRTKGPGRGVENVRQYTKCGPLHPFRSTNPYLSEPVVGLGEIQEPERTLFAEAMGRYGY